MVAQTNALQLKPLPVSAYLRNTTSLLGIGTLNPLELQSRFGDNPLKFQVSCPQLSPNETAVLKGFNLHTYCLL